MRPTPLPMMRSRLAGGQPAGSGGFVEVEELGTPARAGGDGWKVRPAWFACTVVTFEASATGTSIQSASYCFTSKGLGESADFGASLPTSSAYVTPSGAISRTRSGTSAEQVTLSVFEVAGVGPRVPEGQELDRIETA